MLIAGRSLRWSVCLVAAVEPSSAALLLASRSAWESGVVAAAAHSLFVVSEARVRPAHRRNTQWNRRHSEQWDRRDHCAQRARTAHPLSHGSLRPLCGLWLTAEPPSNRASSSSYEGHRTVLCHSLSRMPFRTCALSRVRLSVPRPFLRSFLSPPLSSSLLHHVFCSFFPRWCSVWHGQSSVGYLRHRS